MGDQDRLETRALDLINAGIDGELDSDERSELDAILASSAEARIMQAELQKLANVLDGMPEQAPPADLADRILQRTRTPRGRIFALPRIFASSQAVPAGLAFAAGLLLTIAVYEMAPSQFSDRDVSSMVGTMVVGSRGEQLRQETELDISGPGVVGAVTLTDTGNLVVLSFDVTAERKTEIVVAMADTGLGFGGIAREAYDEANTGEYYEVSGGELRVVNERTHPFTVYLRRIDPARASSRQIGIEVIHSGGSVFQGSLDLDDQRG